MDRPVIPIAPHTFRYPGGSARTRAQHWFGDRDALERSDDDVQFIYDRGHGCTFGIGRLCAVRYGDGVTRYRYDAFGQVTRQTDTSRASPIRPPTPTTPSTALPA